MVGRLGFEPRTNDLKGRCSTVELSTPMRLSREERGVIRDASTCGQGKTDPLDSCCASGNFVRAGVERKWEY